MRLKDKKCGNCYHSLLWTYEDKSQIMWCILPFLEAEEVNAKQKACDKWEFDNWMEFGEEELESDR